MRRGQTIPGSRPLLRPGGPADFEFIRRLSVSVFSHLGDYDRIIPAWLDHDGVISFILEDEGAPAGFFMLGYYKIPYANAYAADLLAIAVAPEAQGRGFGKLLLAEAVATARSARRRLPVRELRLTVAEPNARARNLFRATGFADVAGDHGHYDGGQRALLMRFTLDDD